MIGKSDRLLPAGAEILSSGGVHFRVWAPEHSSIDVVLDGHEPSFHPLASEGTSGYFSGAVHEARSGSRYKYRIDGETWYPDPASRFQPQGPHDWSEVIDPGAYAWSDRDWQGAGIRGQVAYELHVGAFTQEGTWQAAIPFLPELVDTGVTLIELLPVCEFPGEFGWGYDGVNPYAPTHLYGASDDLRAFVNEAHRLGIAVILDAVYNHLGPDGNYLRSFSPYYFTDEHETDWGDAINFYGEGCQPVREYFIANAGYWITEFHMDGLRLDATQNIYDESPDHILAALTREVRRAAGARSTVVIGENEPQDVTLIQTVERGGYGMDALWNDDYHHSAMVRLTGRSEAYYTDYKGSPQEFISAAKYGYLYQGQWYKWQRQRRGSSSLFFAPYHFVTFTQNHDQIANSARGMRAHQLASPGMHRAMTALTLLSPGTPMLFQGEEFNASAPFLYFADHKPDIAQLVSEGRRKFLGQFRSLSTRDMWSCFADPHDRNTFTRCKLDHAERERNSEAVALYRDLLRLRRSESAFRRQELRAVDGAVLSDDALVLRFFDEAGDDRLLLVNFGRDLHLDPAPEPLLAPPQDMEWDVIFSTEGKPYGGCGVPEADTVENWRIPGQAALVLKPAPRRRTVTNPDEVRNLSAKRRKKHV